MKLPIPQNRAALMAALAWTVISFALYYGVIYSPLQAYYGERLFFNYTADMLCSSADASKVVVTAQIPQKVSSFTQRWIYINIYNNQSLPLDIKIWVSLATASDNTPEKTLLLPYMFTNERFVREIEFENLQPNAIGVGRIPLLAFEKHEDLIVRFWTNQPTCGAANLTQEAYQIQFNNASSDSVSVIYDAMGSFLSSVIEILLLPPLANGLVPIVVMFSIWLIDWRREDDMGDSKNERSDSKKLVKLFFDDLIDGFVPIGAVGLLLFWILGMNLLLNVLFTILLIIAGFALLWPTKAVLEWNGLGAQKMSDAKVAQTDTTKMNVRRNWLEVSYIVIRTRSSKW